MEMADRIHIDALLTVVGRESLSSVILVMFPVGCR